VIKKTIPKPTFYKFESP